MTASEMPQPSAERQYCAQLNRWKARFSAPGSPSIATVHRRHPQGRLHIILRPPLLGYTPVTASPLNSRSSLFTPVHVRSRIARCPVSRIFVNPR